MMNRLNAVFPGKYTRMAGILLLLSFLAGIIGEFYAPVKLITSNASTTANNIRTFNLLFGLGFVCYLIEAVCDIALALIFYVLLNPVHKYLALMAAFFRLVSTSTFAGAMLLYFSASVVLKHAAALDMFSAEQIDGLAFLLTKFYTHGSGVYMIFYGVASILFGYLIFRSGYLPRFLGVLLVLGGCGFVLNSFMRVLTPSYASDLVLLPMIVAGLSLTFWFLVKGIDGKMWQASMRRLSNASDN